MSKRENGDRSADNNTEQDIASSSQSQTSTSQDHAATTIDNDNLITIINHKNTLQTFVERSPLGVQFAIMVLFYLARAYRNDINKSKPANKADGGADLSPFSFASKEFLNTYSELASEMGLTKYLLRHMAFAEFMLTLEYLALVREDELTANYRLKVDFQDLKWLASIALQQIAGGQSLSSPMFYRSHSPSAMPSGTRQSGEPVNSPTMANSNRADDLIKELSQSIFSREEIEIKSGGGTSRSYDDFVRPRSRDYGIDGPYSSHRVPPTTYSFRRPDDGEWKRIIKEFFDGQKCITCNAQIRPQCFDIWIGEPLDDDAAAGSKRDQRMTELLADIDNVNAFSHNGATFQEQVINSGQYLTDRELLTYSYGIIPMEGRDAFIAFAKQKLSCPTCGTNSINSVSLMPKY